MKVNSIFGIQCCVILFSALSVEGFFDFIGCQFFECCRKPYLKQDFNKLDHDLKKNLHGQPLVIKTVVEALRAHFNLKNPSKPLVISFHGSTGVGKSFVSQFIVESMFKKGSQSKYVKRFIATKDFPHNSEINRYKEKIKKTIEETVRECHSSLFIFDETDKIPIGLMDVIKAYIDFNDQIEGIDYRHAVFVFLSNSASELINNITFELTKRNIDRSSFKATEFNDKIMDAVFKTLKGENKGLGRATIIENYLIDFYVPFLPLERIHVKQCVKTELLKNNFSSSSLFKVKRNMEKDQEEVADQMNYEPPGYKLFSSSGCKRIPSLVRNLIVQRGYETIKDEL